MESKFDLKPPNDDFNTSDYDFNMSELVVTVKDGKIYRCGDNTSAKLESRYDRTPMAFSADLVEEQIQSDKEVCALLVALHGQRWARHLHSKLTSMLVIKFETDWIYKHDRHEHDLAANFWKETPGYNGGFRGSTREDYEEYLATGKMINSLTAAEKETAKKVFRNQAMLITQWAMNDFSYRGTGEKWTGDIRPLEIITELTIESEDDIIKLPKKMLTKEEKAEEKRLEKEAAKIKAANDRKNMLAAMTPQQRMLFLAKENNARILASLRKNGKVDEETTNLLTQ